MALTAEDRTHLREIVREVVEEAVKAAVHAALANQPQSTASRPVAASQHLGEDPVLIGMRKKEYWCDKGVKAAIAACEEETPLTRKDLLKHLGSLGSLGSLAEKSRCGGSSGAAAQPININAAIDAYRRLLCSWLLAGAFPLSFCNQIN